MNRTYSNEISKNIGKEVRLLGWIHKIRKLGGLSFIILRDSKGIAQAIIDQKEDNKKLEGLTTETVIELIGKVKKEERSPGGAEVLVTKINIISPVKEDIPVEINKKELNVNLDTLLDSRTLTLRAPKVKAIFKVQAEILKAFREFFSSKDFTEINTPKIVSAGAETGGAEMFDLKYFKKGKAFLAQSPQLYKQIMVSVFERVFETAYVYRAEPSATTRHLTEYLSLDVEMGFINSYEELMDIQAEFFVYLNNQLEKTCALEFEVLGATLPSIPKKIPSIKLSEAQEILEKEYKEKCLGEPDLEPRHEKQICEWASKKFNSDFIFITHFPVKKRPFYSAEDANDPGFTLSFDLLFRGLELSTGGQRLHLIEEILPKMKEKKIDPKEFKEYLDIFRFGMPPHGGFAFGLERLTARMLELDNVKEASLFPRDMTRLKP